MKCKFGGGFLLTYLYIFSAFRKSCFSSLQHGSQAVIWSAPARKQKNQATGRVHLPQEQAVVTQVIGMGVVRFDGSCVIFFSIFHILVHTMKERRIVA